MEKNSQPLKPNSPEALALQIMEQREKEARRQPGSFVTPVALIGSSSNALKNAQPIAENSVLSPEEELEEERIGRKRLRERYGKTQRA